MWSAPPSQGLFAQYWALACAANSRPEARRHAASLGSGHPKSGCRGMRSVPSPPLKAVPDVPLLPSSQAEGSFRVQRGL